MAMKKAKQCQMVKRARGGKKAKQGRWGVLGEELACYLIYRAQEGCPWRGHLSKDSNNLGDGDFSWNIFRKQEQGGCTAGIK